MVDRDIILHPGTEPKKGASVRAKHWHRGLLGAVSVVCGCLILYAALLSVVDLIFSALLFFLMASAGCFLFFFGARSTTKRQMFFSLAIIFAGLAAFEFGALLYVSIFIQNAPDAPRYGSHPATYRATGGELGYGPKPSRAVRVRKVVNGRIVYDVEYTINDYALRETRSNPESQCSFLFYGGSFVFGEGLPDIQTLPYQFSRKLNYNFNVLNFGFDGYGPHQMLRSLQAGAPDALIKGSVKAVFYVLIPPDVFRSAGLTRWNRYGPKYVVDEAGRPRHVGTLNGMGGALGTWNDFTQALLAVLRNSRLFNLVYGFPETRDPKHVDRSIELLSSIVAEAERITANKYGARFIVIMWSDASDISKKTLAALKYQGLHTIDKSELLLKDWGDHYLITGDRHPNELANREIATGLANRFGDCS